MNLVLLCHLTTNIDSHRAERDQSGFPIKPAATVAADRGKGQGIKTMMIRIHVWRLGIVSSNSICSSLTGYNLLHLSQMYQILFFFFFCWSVCTEDMFHTLHL